MLKRFIQSVPILYKTTSLAYSKIRRSSYGKVVTKTIKGATYEHDLSENIDSSLYYKGFWEENTTASLESYIRPDMIIFEVGANIGAHTMRIAKLLGESKGKLFSFEPTEYTFKKPKRNFDLNDFSNTRIENFGLSLESGSIEIVRASSKETMPFKASWDLKNSKKNAQLKDTIVFKRLDDYFDSQELDKLDLIKIDTDGYELKVLKGAEKTIGKLKPPILIEIGRTVELVGDTLEELIELLTNHGYSFYPIDMEGEVMTGDQIIKDSDSTHTMDCLCRVD